MTASVQAPTFEHHREPIGIGEASPRMSWKTTADSYWEQGRYELEIRRGGERTTFVVQSADSVLVPWPDSPLRSRESAAVRVRVSGSHGIASTWSDWSVVEAGLLDPLDWTAAGIGASWSEDPESDTRRPPLLRRSFRTRGGIARARLYATAHGLFEMEINGRRVGRDAFAPGWTVYPVRLRYFTYDVTELLAEGENAIGAWMADGWWRGRYGFHGGHRNIYGTDLSLLAQLEVTYDDGSVDTIGTGPEWRARPAPILSTGLYDGETYDHRELPTGWSTPAYDATTWSPVRIAEFATGTLEAPAGPPVRCTEELVPASITRTAEGTVLVDFGQNFAGRVHIRAGSGVGDELVVHHAEVLQDGRLFRRTLRDAVSIDRYLGSDGSIDWEPRFTIHGFRYAEISGYDGELRDITIVGRVYHSDMARTGWLTTSDPRLNRLHENALWSMRSNFVDIPTDCPQRDERLGWTGDIQVFAPTASFLYDVSGFLTSWLRDVAIEQRRFGTVPWYVPVINGAPQWTPIRPGAVWGDVATLTPWTLFERFADREVLVRQYDSAKAWVDQVAALAGPDRLWITGYQLGDWLDPAAPPEDPAKALTDPYLVATAYFAWSAGRLAETAAELGRTDDAATYSVMAREIRAAFRHRWCLDDGELKDPTQTGYALAIAFGLLEGDDAAAGRALADLVTGWGNRIGAGFAGVNLVADALSRTGHTQVAYDLLFEERTPSWLSMVNKGATTIWERWDSLLDDGTVNPGEMTSFNHYALGSIADWMHRTIGGIEATAPAYRRIRFAPVPDHRLTSASALLESPYGTIRSQWTLDDRRFVLAVTVPTGTSAVVVLPSSEHAEVGPGTHHFSCDVVDARSFR